ncbi:hypothetical protein K438DRAFT_1767614 [Mycena galopus ATCC 62051]|nr:hypothetical protein K438DRAFT_1767614 [Mycena galopus ATCC 62051]
MGVGMHMDYLDFPPGAIELVNRFLLKWYNSDRWRDFLKNEQEFNESLAKMERTLPKMKELHQLPGNLPSGFNQNEYGSFQGRSSMRKSKFTRINRLTATNDPAAAPIDLTQRRKMLNGRNLTRRLSVGIARLAERPLISLCGAVVAAALKDIAPPHWQAHVSVQVAKEYRAKPESMGDHSLRKGTRSMWR